jgi:hypothetical protein
MADDPLLTPAQFAATIKAKYPDYQAVPDDELVSRVLVKYPEYRDRVQVAPAFSRRGGMTDPAMVSPDFRTTNERDALGNPTVDPNTVGTAVSHLAHSPLNPLPMVTALGRALIPEAVGRLIDPGVTEAGAKSYGPINALSNLWDTVKGMGAAQGALYDRAKRAYDKGDYVTAARHFVNYLDAVAGPGLDRSSDEFQAGKWVAGGADAIGLGLALAAPKGIAVANEARTAAATRAGQFVADPNALTSAQFGELASGPKRPQVSGAPLTEAEARSNALADAEGVPLSAATRTANPAVAGAQKLAGHTFFGSGTLQRFRAAQDTALTNLGERLAGEVSPTAMTPRTAGEAVQGRVAAVAEAEQAAQAADLAAAADAVHPTAIEPLAAGRAAQGRIQGAMRQYGDVATQNYDTLRAIEADPANAERVLTAPPGSAAFRSIHGKLTTGVESALGDTNPEIQAWAQRVGGRGPTSQELGVMRQIEAELEAQPYTPYLLRPGKYGSSLEHVEGTGGAGAPVYHDILNAAPNAPSMTRGEVQDAIAKTLETGEWNNASRGAFTVAQQRLRSSGALGGPVLPEGAPLLGATRNVALPVDVGGVKAQLSPLYDRLLRESQLGIPMQGGKGRALAALDGLMRGPDVESATVVDAALGDLKSLARADIPELRTEGQGVAAAAVKRLSAAVDAAVAKAGPQAVDALETGRQATRAKYAAGDIYKDLQGEPGTAFRTLTQGDNGVEFLKAFAEHAPESVPELGRATLESWAELTPQQRLARWQKLGPETRAQLFGRQAGALEDALTQATGTPQDAAAIARRLGREPVGAYEALTQDHDAGLAFLRDVQQQAPESLPEIGRAKLQEWLSKATENDKFEHAAKIYSEWQKLGPETKRALFGGPAQVQRLDDFFTLAKRIGFDPNPSGTASTAATGTALAVFTNPLFALKAQIGGYALAKVLTTPQGAALVNRALNLSLKAPSLGNVAATRDAWAAVANASRATTAPVAAPAAPLAFPRAAHQQPSR